MLDLLWIKLDERFTSMSDAYRYFDRNFNNRVSFGEFQKALDHLRIKFQVSMIDEIFQFLDKGRKGYIGYQDFCELAEERRRNIDAFGGATDLLNKSKGSFYESKGPFNTQENFIHNYLDHSEPTDLEAMSKWRKPSTFLKTSSCTNALVPAG